MAKDVESYLVVSAPGASPIQVGVTIDYRDVRTLPKAYQDRARIELKAAMQRTIKQGLAILIPLIPEGPMPGGGTALKSVKVDFTGQQAQSFGEVTGFFYSDLDYMLNLEFGRSPGSMPPVAPLESWAIRKFHAAGKGMGYAIARAIGERGIPGHHMFEQTHTQLTPIANANFEKAVANAVAYVNSTGKFGSAGIMSNPFAH